MSSKIYVLRDGENMTSLTETAFTDEDIFQALIEQHPEILAGDLIDPENPRKWILIRREMGIPTEQGGGSQFSLDHLFIDQDRIPTFVEVKRSSNTESRRLVVAQMLDYAANATKYWPIEQLIDAYENTINSGDYATLSDLDVMPDDEEAFWDQVSVNLRAGNIRLLFVNDIIPKELRAIIEYLNEQMSPTDVFGIEIKQYLSKDDKGLKTLVPSIVGKTQRANISSSTGTRLWDEQSLLEQTKKLEGDGVAGVCQKLLRDAESLGCKITWGRGKGSGFSVRLDLEQSHYIYYVANRWKNMNIELCFKDIRQTFDVEQQRAKLKDAFERIPGVTIPKERIDKYPSFPVKLLCESSNYDLFIEAVKMYIDDIRKSEE